MTLVLLLLPIAISSCSILDVLGVLANVTNVQIEESLLVLSTLGIQTTTLSPSYLLPSNTRFIPTSQIRDIFIHEAFKGFEVRYYLAIVVEGEGSVVVVFPVSVFNTWLILG